MPVDRIGFMLKPDGFFDRNPALDVPRRRTDITRVRTSSAGERVSMPGGRRPPEGNR